MVSLDSPEKNRAFAESLATTKLLLSDPTGLAASAYGVSAGGGKYARRVTFYIDREGLIRFVDRNVDVSNAGEGIAKRLGALGFAKTSE